MFYFDCAQGTQPARGLQSHVTVNSAINFIEHNLHLHFYTGSKLHSQAWIKVTNEIIQSFNHYTVGLQVQENSKLIFQFIAFSHEIDLAEKKRLRYGHSSAD